MSNTMPLWLRQPPRSAIITRLDFLAQLSQRETQYMSNFSLRELVKLGSYITTVLWWAMFKEDWAARWRTTS